MGPASSFLFVGLASSLLSVGLAICHLFVGCCSSVVYGLQGPCQFKAVALCRFCHPANSDQIGTMLDTACRQQRRSWLLLCTALHFFAFTHRHLSFRLCPDTSVALHA